MFLAAFVLFAAGSLGALPADRAIRQYVRRTWTVEQGLPHGTVRGVAQTADGYLWLATYEGLIRFNAEKFRILDKAYSPAVLSNSIVTLLRTRDDTLWLGTLAGLMRYRNGVFTTIPMEGGPEIVYALAASPDGTVFAGTARGLLRIEGERAVAVPVPLPKKPITSLAANQSGVWIGTSDGLSRYRGGKLESWTSANGLSGNTIVTLASDGDDAIFAGHATGLDRVSVSGDAVTIQHIDGLPADQVTALRRDRDRNLWIGTYSHGLHRMTATSLANGTTANGIDSFGIGDGLLNPTVRAIFEDDEGSIWIGTNGGLEKLHPGAFVNWDEKDGLTDAVARVIFEDRDGVLWVGTATNLSRWNGSAFEHVDNPRLTGILSIAQGRDGTFWFGTLNGVYRVAGGRTKRFSTAEGLSHNTARAIHEDQRGDVWIATDFGLNRIRPNGSVESFAGRDGLGTHYAMAIDESRDGHVWIATGGGLAEFDGKAFRLHAAPRALPSNRLFALKADDDGTVWITTDGDGLVRFRNGQSKTITTREGLPTDKILSLVDDGQGNLWFGTVRGTFKASKRTLHAIADGKAARLTETLRDENDGLGSRQCNGLANPAALRSRDGRIWFVTGDGVSALTAGTPPMPSLRAPIIERVSVNGRNIGPNDMRFPPGADRIEFEFASMTFVAPERVRFRYRLDGYDDHWVDVEPGRRVVSYTKLPAGDYRFVLASSRDGATWRDTALPFTRLPRFYETKWFTKLAAVLIVGLLLAAHHVRMHFARQRARHLEHMIEDRNRQISEEKKRTELAQQAAEAVRRAERARAEAEQANQARNIFFALTSHELRTPLNAIIGFSDILLSHTAQQMEPRHARFLENIHSSGEYLLGIINNILDLSRVEAGRMEIQPEAFELRHEVLGICSVMKGVTSLHKIFIDVDIPAGLILEADLTMIKQVIYNLLSNAVKFSPEQSTVHVTARRNGDAVEIQVRDSGVGIDPKDHQLIFQEFRQAEGPRGERPNGAGLGLALVRHFVELHHGTIGVESELGKGSTFTVVLPKIQVPVPANDQELLSSSP